MKLTNIIIQQAINLGFDFEVQKEALKKYHLENVLQDYLEIVSEKLPKIFIEKHFPIHRNKWLNYNGEQYKIFLPEYIPTFTGIIEDVKIVHSYIIAEHEGLIKEINFYKLIKANE